jgi:hypothetical protein
VPALEDPDIDGNASVGQGLAERLSLSDRSAVVIPAVE